MGLCVYGERDGRIEILVGLSIIQTDEDDDVCRRKKSNRFDVYVAPYVHPCVDRDLCRSRLWAVMCYTSLPA